MSIEELRRKAKANAAAQDAAGVKNISVSNKTMVESASEVMDLDNRGLQPQTKQDKAVSAIIDAQTRGVKQTYQKKVIDPINAAQERGAKRTAYTQLGVSSDKDYYQATGSGGKAYDAAQKRREEIKKEKAELQAIINKKGGLRSPTARDAFSKLQALDKEDKELAEVKKAGFEDMTFGERASEWTKGLLAGAGLNYGAGLLDTNATLYEASQGSRSQMNSMMVEDAKRNYETALRDLQMMKEDGESEKAIAQQQSMVDQFKATYDAMAHGLNDETQSKAIAAARDFDADVARKGAEYTQRAVDVGNTRLGQQFTQGLSSAIQSAVDGALAAAVAPGTMIPFAIRCFGNSTIEARNSGADINTQLVYGMASTAKEVLTEKMGNIGGIQKMAYGKGFSGYEDAITNGIKRAVDAFADSGASAMQQELYSKSLTLLASMFEEGFEEFVGDIFDPAISYATGVGELPKNFNDWLENAANDFVVGSLSALAGMPAPGIRNTISDAQYAKVGKNIKAAGYDTLVEIEKASLINNESVKDVYEKAWRQYRSTNGVTDATLGQLYSANQQELARLTTQGRLLNRRSTLLADPTTGQVSSLSFAQEYSAQNAIASNKDVKDALDKARDEMQKNGQVSFQSQLDLRNAMSNHEDMLKMLGLSSDLYATTAKTDVAVNALKTTPSTINVDSAVTAYTNVKTRTGGSMSLDIAKDKADIATRLANGEAVTQIDLNKLQLDSKNFIDAFNQVAGTQLTPKKYTVKQVMDAVNEVRVQRQQQRDNDALAISQMVQYNQYMGTDLAKAQGMQTDEMTLTPMLNTSDSVETPIVTEAERGASASSNAERTIQYAGQTMSKQQFGEYLNAHNNGEVATPEEINDLFERAYTAQNGGSNGERENVSDGSSERDAGKSAGERSENVVGRTAEAEGGAAEDHQVKLDNGRTITAIGTSKYTPEMQKISSAFKGVGYRVEFTNEPIPVFIGKDVNGVDIWASADGETSDRHKRIILQANAMRTLDELYKHEYTHARLNGYSKFTRQTVVREFIEKAKSELPDGAYNELLKGYLLAYSGVASSIKNSAERELYVMEECLADSFGQLNRKGALDAFDMAKLNMIASDALRSLDKQDDLEEAAEDTYREDLEAFNDKDEVIARATEDGTVRLSMSTYDSDGRAYLVNYLNKAVKKKDLTEADAEDILRQLDAIYDICKTAKDARNEDGTPKYLPFSNWSDAAVITAEKGNPVFSVVKKNGEYSLNLDFSLVCKKRRTLDMVLSELTKNGVINNMNLAETDISKINDLIRSHGFETACALCFVDAKRYRVGLVADAFTSLYNTEVKLIKRKDGKPIKYKHFNYGGTMSITNENADTLDTIPTKDLDFSALDEYLKTGNDGEAFGKDSVEAKTARLLKQSAKQRQLLLRGDFISAESFESVKKNNPEVMKLYNSKKGTGGPKASEGDVQYLNDILKKYQTFTRNKAYLVGGVRIQSFSDYIPRMVFDYAQMVSELAAKKLPAHAYTKEELFVLQFGLTGIKINMSLIPDVVEGGVAPGLDANGEYVWRDGQSFGGTVNEEGSAQRGFELALRIQSAEGYSKNCGTIAVGISDEHIRKMMSDPNIRMIIPYHKSSLNHEVAMMNNVGLFTDYTKSQNTRHKDGTALDKEKDKKLLNALPDFNRMLFDGTAKTPQEAIEKYVRFCEENDLLPKFNQFVYKEIDGVPALDADGKRVIDENYYKLIEDFTVYDNGEYVPQGDVQMQFPDENSAFGSMDDLINRGLEEDALLAARQDKEVPVIVKEITESVRNSLTDDETRHSLIEMTPDTFVDHETGEYVHYSLAENPPKKVLTNEDGSPKYVYKAFFAYNGKLYPPMISSLTDEELERVPGAVSGTLNGLETPVGVWLTADVGSLARDKNGKAIRNSLGRLAVVNSKGGGTLAFRPGWHLGEWPDAKQFNVGPRGADGKRHLTPDSLVFAKCLIAADVDYQLDAMSYGVGKKGNFTRTLAGLPGVPENGYYKYRTNADPDTAPWYITGAMKIVEILDDDDTAALCAEFGVTPDPRESGKKIDLAAYGLKRGPVTPTGDLQRFVKNQKNIENERALQEELNNPDYADAYVSRPINFKNRRVIEEFARNHQDVEYYRAKAQERDTRHSLIDDTALTGDESVDKFVTDTRYSMDARTVTFFSGAGTVDYALRNMINSRLAVEYDAKIAAVYKMNNGEDMFIGDVRDVDLSKFPEGQIEYFHASPVCKNYSNAKIVDEADNQIDITTAQATANALRKFKPKVFTVENVARYRNSKAMKLITDTLDDLGYKYDKEVYRATDFGGATIRERMFLRAVAPGGTLPTIEKKQGTNWYNAVYDLIPGLKEEKMPDWMTARLPAMNIKSVNDITEPLLIIGGNKGGKLSMAWYNQPSPTILANTHDARIVMPGGKVLRVSPRVLARIQGLPDSFKLPDKTTLAFKVIGNGVPVQMTQGIVGPLLDANIQRAEDNTRYSISDAEYLELAKDPEKNRDQLQQMVDEAAKNAGYDIKAYHGTEKEFTKFDRSKIGINYDDMLEYGAGFYFTPSEKEAKKWAENGRRINGNTVLNVYLSADRMFDPDSPVTDEGAKSVLAGHGFSTRDIDFTLRGGYRYIQTLLDLGHSNLEVQEELKRMGYDGIDASYGYKEKNGQYIVFDPEQVKSADPVTYDDAGNVIPLSERFNDKNEDIRYSISEDSTGRKLSAQQQEYFKDSKVRDENGNLLVVYHGSKNSFNSFEYGHTNSWNMLGDGFYFTPDSKRADAFGRGGKVISAYLNLTNPLVSIDPNHIAALCKKIGKPLSYINKWADKKGYGSGDMFRIANFADDNHINLKSAIEELGFDGIMYYSYGRLGEIVAYKSSQAKITDNLNPTEDPDIRYSISAEAQAEFDEMLKQYGAQPQSPRDVRDEKFPTRTNEDTKVERSGRTIANAEITSEARIDSIKDATLSGKFDYVESHNKVEENKAKQRVKLRGYQSAKEQFIRDVEAGKTGPSLVAMGATLINNAGNNSNCTAEEYIELVTVYSDLLTRSGQAVQAAQILQKMTPEGRLYGIIRSVKKMNDEILEKSKFDPDEDVDIDGKMYKIPDELIDAYRKAQTDEERDEIVKQMVKAVAAQVPTTNIDRFTAWRYLNMLGNFRTQIRNVLGNAFFQPVRMMKDAVAGLLESIIPVEERTASVKVDPATMKVAYTIFEDYREAILSGGKYKDDTGMDFKGMVMDERQIFGKTKSETWNKTGGKLLEGYRTITNKAMDKGDEWFCSFTFADSLGRFMAANNTTWENASESLRTRAINKAIKDAAEATYRDNTKLATWVSSLGRKQDTPVAVRYILEGVVPFRKTPANILMRAFEYSPAGFALAAYDAVAMKKGTKEVSGNEIIDELAKGLTGSGLIALGFALAAVGNLIGRAPEDDKEKELFEQRGYQAYSLVLNGRTYTLDWLAPECIPMFLGANLHQTGLENGIKMKDLMSAISLIGDPLLEMSMLQGINDAIENAATYGTEAALLTFVTNSMVSYASQYVTNTLVGQVKRGLNNTRMTTYVDKNSNVPVNLQRTLGKASGKMPIPNSMGYNQIPYIDAWGDTEQNADTATLNFLQQLFSPSYVSKIEQDRNLDELERLYQSTGDSGVVLSPANKYINVKPVGAKVSEKRELTAAQYMNYAMTRGQTAKAGLAELINTPQYAGLTDEAKAEAINRVYKYADETAKKTVFDDYVPASWSETSTEKSQSAGVSVPTYSAVYAATKNVESMKNASGKSVDDSKSLRMMQIVYQYSEGLSKEQIDALAEEIGVSKTVRKYNANLVDSKLKALERLYGQYN